jgi:hypothetical protein
MTRPSETPVDIKPRSRDVTDGNQKAAARAMLRAVGLTDEDFKKPQIGIASAWNEVTPCNASLRRLAESAKIGVRANDTITTSRIVRILPPEIVDLELPVRKRSGGEASVLRLQKDYYEFEATVRD